MPVNTTRPVHFVEHLGEDYDGTRHELVIVSGILNLIDAGGRLVVSSESGEDFEQCPVEARREVAN